MMNRTVALALALLTVSASSASAVELATLQKGAHVRTLGPEFKREFAHLKDGLFAGKSTLDGVIFVTFVEVDRDGEIKSVRAEQDGADLATYETLLPSARKLLSADLDTFQTDDCSGDAGGSKRGNGVFSGGKLQVFEHVWVSGKSQLLHFSFGPSLVSTGEKGLDLLSAHSSQRVRELSKYAQKRADIPVPIFAPACSSQVRESLSLPGLEALTDTEISRLGPATPLTQPSGTKPTGWNHLFAGVSGRLTHTPSTSQLGARWAWSTGTTPEPTSSDVARSLEALERELGAPTTIDRIKWPKGGVTLRAWNAQQERITASTGEKPDGTRFIGISRESNQVQAPEAVPVSGLPRK
jgi:hypothetical protein